MALVNVRLSQDAYKGLLSLCEAYNYYNANALANRGISRLLCAASYHKITWHDNRPSYIKESDDQADLFQQARIWSTGEQKVQYSLGNSTPLTYLILIAYIHQIKSFPEQRKMLQATNLRSRVPITNSPLSIASAVLEAIGLYYLTPSTVIPIFTPANDSIRKSNTRRRLRERLGIHKETYQ